MDHIQGGTMKKILILAIGLACLGLYSKAALAHGGKEHAKHGMKHARHHCTEEGLKAGTPEFKKCMASQKEEMKEEKAEHHKAHKKHQ